MLHALISILTKCLAVSVGCLVGVLLLMAWDRFLPPLPRPKTMPLRLFGGTDVVFTEEDWHRHSKDMYPIRYFFQETLPNLFKTKE